ncbi:MULTISPECIES: hypothetical protein [Flavobacterium]|nr:MULTISPECIES: hypothetical protein [Flavobacterium]
MKWNSETLIRWGAQAYKEVKGIRCISLVYSGAITAYKNINS